MGRPEQNGSGAVIAVIVVGLLLLFVVVGGAAVLLGGLFFVALESAPQQVSVRADYAQPMAITSEAIQIDATGEISIGGETYTLDELRTKLEEMRDDTGYAPPSVNPDPNCPEDVRTEVIQACEEVFGALPLVHSREPSPDARPEIDEVNSGEPTD